MKGIPKFARPRAILDRYNDTKLPGYSSTQAQKGYAAKKPRPDRSLIPAALLNPPDSRHLIEQRASVFGAIPPSFNRKNNVNSSVVPETIRAGGLDLGQTHVLRQEQKLELQLKPEQRLEIRTSLAGFDTQAGSIYERAKKANLDIKSTQLFDFKPPAGEKRAASVKGIPPFEYAVVTRAEFPYMWSIQSAGLYMDGKTFVMADFFEGHEGISEVEKNKMIELIALHEYGHHVLNNNHHKASMLEFAAAQEAGFLERYMEILFGDYPIKFYDVAFKQMGAELVEIATDLGVLEKTDQKIDPENGTSAIDEREVISVMVIADSFRWPENLDRKYRTKLKDAETEHAKWEAQAKQKLVKQMVLDHFAKKHLESALEKAEQMYRQTTDRKMPDAEAGLYAQAAFVIEMQKLRELAEVFDDVSFTAEVIEPIFARTLEQMRAQVPGILLPDCFADLFKYIQFASKWVEPESDNPDTKPEETEANFAKALFFSRCLRSWITKTYNNVLTAAEVLEEKEYVIKSAWQDVADKQKVHPLPRVYQARHAFLQAAEKLNGATDTDKNLPQGTLQAIQEQIAYDMMKKAPPRDWEVFNQQQVLSARDAAKTANEQMADELVATYDTLRGDSTKGDAADFIFTATLEAHDRTNAQIVSAPTLSNASEALRAKIQILWELEMRGRLRKSSIRDVYQRYLNLTEEDVEKRSQQAIARYEQRGAANGVFDYFDFYNQFAQFRVRYPNRDSKNNHYIAVLTLGYMAVKNYNQSKDQATLGYLKDYLVEHIRNSSNIDPIFKAEVDWSEVVNAVSSEVKPLSSLLYLAPTLAYPPLVALANAGNLLAWEAAVRFEGHVPEDTQTPELSATLVLKKNGENAFGDVMQYIASTNRREFVDEALAYFASDECKYREKIGGYIRSYFASLQRRATMYFVLEAIRHRWIEPIDAESPLDFITAATYFLGSTSRDDWQQEITKRLNIWLEENKTKIQERVKNFNESGDWDELAILLDDAETMKGLFPSIQNSTTADRLHMSWQELARQSFETTSESSLDLSDGFTRLQLDLKDADQIDTLKEAVEGYLHIDHPHILKLYLDAVAAKKISVEYLAYSLEKAAVHFRMQSSSRRGSDAELNEFKTSQYTRLFSEAEDLRADIRTQIETAGTDFNLLDALYSCYVAFKSKKTIDISAVEKLLRDIAENSESAAAHLVSKGFKLTSKKRRR